MKTKVVFLQCMILSAVVFGQNEMQKSLPEIEVIPPNFPAVETIWNGKKINSINDYLKEYVEYPERALNDGYYGTEVVQFVVTTAGELADIKIVNSICPDIDIEVIRVLKTTNGSWQPASVNSKPVPMAKEVSLVFNPNKTVDFVSRAKSYSNQGNKKLFLENDPKKALKYYDMGIALLPNEYALLVTRGMCLFELGNEDEARRDWERCHILSETDKVQIDSIYLTDIKKLKGYSEMIQLIQK